MQTAGQLQIGVLNDLHYDGGVDGLNRLYESVTALNRSDAALLIVLGDLIESGSESNALRLLREVSALCDAFRGKVRYMPGNHDLDYISKAQFYNALGCAGDSPTCRLQLNGIDLICLDGNFSPDGTEYDSGNFEWQQSYIPEEQLDWLKTQLDEAPSEVLLFSHQRLDSDDDFAVRNHDAVRDVIRSSGKVKAVFQGHQHADDLRKIDDTVCYTLGAHKDDAGPALVNIDTRGIRLVRDYRSAASAETEAIPHQQA